MSFFTGLVSFFKNIGEVIRLLRDLAKQIERRKTKEVNDALEDLKKATTKKQRLEAIGKIQDNL
jgi:Zn-dependent M16 (insulinase) family peptidase